MFSLFHSHPPDQQKKTELFATSHVLFFVDFSSLFTAIMHDLVLKCVILESKICPICELCSFTKLSDLLRSKLFLCWAMNWFFYKSFIGGWKVFFGHGLPFLPNFGLLWAKNAEIWRWNGPINKKVPFVDSSHSNTTCVPISNEFQ